MTIRQGSIVGALVWAACSEHAAETTRASCDAEPCDAGARLGGADAGQEPEPEPDMGTVEPPLGPLAGLPSEPGPTIDRIRALGPDEWVDLGPPAPDPVHGSGFGRSWGGRAFAFAPDIRGAYFIGEGPHAMVKPDGRLMDDVFVYDVHGHRWIAVYPGTDVNAMNEDVRAGRRRIDEHGSVVDETGQPFPIHVLIHAWDLVTYDTRARRLAFVADRGLNRYYLGGLDVMEEGVAALEAQRAMLTAPGHLSPWLLRTLDGRFERWPVSTPTPAYGDLPFFQYLESGDRYFYGGGHGVAYFDPATRTWSEVATSGPPPGGYDHGGCYDPARERIYLGPGTGGTDFVVSVFDIGSSTWSTLTAPGAPAALGTNGTSVICDTVHDVVIALRYGERRVYGYDPDEDSWTQRPFPEAYLRMSYASYHAFHDPELDVIFVYEAPDGGAGTMWAFRHR